MCALCPGIDVPSSRPPGFCSYQQVELTLKITSNATVCCITFHCCVPADGLEIIIAGLL